MKICNNICEIESVICKMEISNWQNENIFFRIDGKKIGNLNAMLLWPNKCVPKTYRCDSK